MNSSTMSNRTRHSYTPREDKLILQYFLDTKDVHHLSGNEVWKRLQASEKYNPGKCSFHSLRERYLKKLRPNLSRYKLSETQIALLTGRPVGSRRTEQLGAGSEGRHKRDSVRQATREETPDNREARASSPEIDDASPPTEPQNTVRRKRQLYQESTPMLPENTTVRETGSLRYRSRLRLNGFLSDSSPSPPPPRRDAPGRQKRNGGLASGLSSEEEIPPSDAEENVPLNVSIGRADSSDRPCDEAGGTSPVIETASHKRKNVHGQDSRENLEGIMCGALVPTQSDQAVSSRTRSSRRAKPAENSDTISPLGYITGESLTRSQRTTRVAFARSIKQENSEETLALVRPDSPSRVSTQDVLRSNVVDTQRESEESFHSAAQSPLRLHSQEKVTTASRSSQKRKNRNASVDDEERVKKTRLATISVNEGELRFPMNLKLKLPERESLSGPAEIAFLDLLESMVKDHVENTWAPHDDCPGMDEFLFMCKNLRDKVHALQFAQITREPDAVVIDNHLHDLFEVPFCTWQPKNRIDCNGAYRHFLGSAHWISLLDNLRSLYEAREIVKSMSGSGGCENGNS